MILNYNKIGFGIIGIYYLISLGGVLSFFKESADKDAEVGFSKIVVSIIYLIIGVLLVRYLNQLKLFYKRNKIYSLFFLFVLLSVFWSINKSVTTVRLLAFIGPILIASYSVLKISRKDLFNLIFVVLLISSIAHFATYILFPEQVVFDSIGAFKSVFGSKNSFGLFLTLTILFFIFKFENLSFHNERFFLAALIVVTFIFLIFTKSTTSLLITFLVGVIFIVNKTKQKIDFRKSNKVLFLIILLLFLGYLLLNLSQFVSLFGKNITFSGRIYLWYYLIIIGVQRPLLGHGYGAFWTDEYGIEKIHSIFSWTPPHAHNGFLEIFLQLGGIGLLLFLIFFGKITRTILKSRNILTSPEYFVSIALLGIILINNMLEYSFIRQHSGLWTLFLTIGFKANQDEG